MYKLYAIFDIDHINWSRMELYAAFLPNSRKEKAQRFQRDIDRKNCILSYWLLQYGLFKECGVRSFSLSFGQNNKPYLSDYPNIHFNISHCDAACICAIADNPIGVDIQNIRPVSEAVVKYCCCAAELQLLKNSANTTAEFIKIWTMKESYLKMTGTGITVDLRSIDTTELRDKVKTFAINDCYISVASAESFQEEKICLI